MNIELFTGSAAILNDEILRQIKLLQQKDMIEIKFEKETEGFKVTLVATVFGSKSATTIISYHPEKQSALNDIGEMSVFYTKRNVSVVLGGCINTTMKDSNVLNAALAYKYATIGNAISEAKTLQAIRNVWMANREAVEMEAKGNEVLKESFDILDAFIQKIKV